MSAPQRISISAKDARAIVAAATEDGADADAYGRAIERIRRALAPRPEKPQRKATRAAKQSKREAKNAETARIRAEVVKRADGCCEACVRRLSPQFDPGELDHFWGRGKAPQSVANCWLLCRLCHRRKTDSLPARTYWLERFETHARFHGHMAEARKARSTIDSLALADAAEQAGKAVRHG